MVIAVMGGHGSGKSTLVRNVMSRYQPRLEVGRRLPDVTFGFEPGIPTLVAMGAYADGAASGIDSGRFQGRVPSVYAAIYAHHTLGSHVIVEGMLLAGTVRRLLDLHVMGAPLTVLLIDMPPEECVEWLRVRKAQRVKGHNRSKLPVNEAVVRDKARGVARAVELLASAGVPVLRGGRREMQAAAFRLAGWADDGGDLGAGDGFSLRA